MKTDSINIKSDRDKSVEMETIDTLDNSSSNLLLANYSNESRTNILLYMAAEEEYLRDNSRYV